MVKLKKRNYELEKLYAKKKLFSEGKTEDLKVITIEKEFENDNCYLVSKMTPVTIYSDSTVEISDNCAIDSKYIIQHAKTKDNTSYSARVDINLFHRYNIVIIAANYIKEEDNNAIIETDIEFASEDHLHQIPIESMPDKFSCLVLFTNEFSIPLVKFFEGDNILNELKDGGVDKLTDLYLSEDSLWCSYDKKLLISKEKHVELMKDQTFKLSTLEDKAKNYLDYNLDTTCLDKDEIVEFDDGSKLEIHTDGSATFTNKSITHELPAITDTESIIRELIKLPKTKIIDVSVLDTNPDSQFINNIINNTTYFKTIDGINLLERATKIISLGIADNKNYIGTVRYIRSSPIQVEEDGSIHYNRLEQDIKFNIHRIFSKRKKEEIDIIFANSRCAKFDENKELISIFGNEFNITVLVNGVELFYSCFNKDIGLYRFNNNLGYTSTIESNPEFKIMSSYARKMDLSVDISILLQTPYLIEYKDGKSDLFLPGEEYVRDPRRYGKVTKLSDIKKELEVKEEE